MATPRSGPDLASRLDGSSLPTTHRSISLQKIASLSTQVGTASTTANSAHSTSRNLALAQLWSQCASSVSLISSAAADSIVSLVQKRVLSWTEAIEGFENALSAAQGQALSNMVHALTGLFTLAAEYSCTIDFNKASTKEGLTLPSPSRPLVINKSMFTIKNNRHPFIALVSTKQNVDAVVFAALDNIMDYRMDSAAYRVAAFEILSPFLDFCLLDREKRSTLVASTAILWISRTLNACLLDSDMKPFIVHLFDYLCSIPGRSTLDRIHLNTTLQNTITALVGFYCLPSVQLSLSPEYKHALGGRLLFTLLSWTADMRRFGLPTLQLLQATQALLRNRKGHHVPTLPFVTLWPLLSYLLMNSPTVAEQCIMVDWMHTIITNETATSLDPNDAMISNLAFLPVFQVMGETQAEIVTKKCSEILQRLEAIPRHAHVGNRAPPPQPLAASGVAAVVQAEIGHLRKAWNCPEGESTSESGEALLTLGDDSILSSLIFTTFLFHPDERKRIQAATLQAQIEDGQLVTLVLFIYVLRVDPSSSVKLHLLQEAIPSLVTSKDETVTAKILRTILTLINGVPNAPLGSKFVNSYMGAVGVRILFLIWKKQPRVWKTLRHVIHGWIESRVRLIKTPVRGDPEYDMEVAILSTIRDICAYDAAGFADVLIPFLATLLGSVELYASSISTIIETINLTVEANVVEPRAAWNVLLCHVAEHTVKMQHSGMIQRMCDFYGIVGSRNEDTQVYLDLRDAILVNYIQPLLSSEDPDILAAALRALSCFTAPEILPILSKETPILYVRERILEVKNALVVDEFSLILDKLVRHELLHMRRGLFKDAAFKKSTADVALGSRELERLQSVLSVVSGNILHKWQTGDVNPGLRSGFALSSLLCSSVASPASLTSSPDADETLQAIRTQQGYRNVSTALTDVTLTDHLVERISALEGWTSLFDNMWISGDDAKTLTVSETLLADLYRKISDSYVPVQCANAVFAVTGIILSLHRHSHPASIVQSSILVKHLLQNFVRSETLSDVGGSDEVQFAVLVSLSFVTPLAAVDEKLVISVLDVFTHRMKEDGASSNASSEILSWASFAAGWAFCNVLAGLVDSPTKTAELNQICQQTCNQLLHVLELKTASFALTLGALIAIPRLSVAVASSSSSIRKTDSLDEDVEAVQRIKAMARADMGAFLENQQQVFSAHGLARLLGAPWVLAFSDRTESSPEERKADTELLDRALLAATARKDLQPQLIHFTVPFCHMIHTNLDVRNPTSSEISVFTGRIHSLVNLIRITPTSAARHTAVVALASLFGVDWSRGPTVTSVGSHGLFSYLSTSSSPGAMVTVANSALTTLLELSGLSISITPTVPGDAPTHAESSPVVHAVLVPGLKAPSAKSALMVQDLKAGRLAAMVLGHVACHFHRLGQADHGKVIGTSTEPKDYARLPVSTSWLRALWEGLWEPLQMGTAQKAQKSYATALELLLFTVRGLPTPLPAVNWFPLLTQLVAQSPQLIVPAIQMASRHANTSTSLMEFLIMSVSNFKIGDDSAVGSDGDHDRQSTEELFVGEEGLGRILTLGGLPLLASPNSDQALAELDKVRGLDGLAKRVSLPGSRVVDLVGHLANVLFNRYRSVGHTNNDDLDPHVEVLQLLFLDTLSNHIRPYRQGRTSPAISHSNIGTDVDANKTLSDDAKELLIELRAMILRVFYSASCKESLSGQRVLRRLADLSLMSLSHLDAARLDASDALGDSAHDKGMRVLKEAIAIASLYRAGYLTLQLEGRLTRVAQSALLVVSELSYGSQNRVLAETGLSVLLYAMNAGVTEKSSPSGTAYRKRKQNALRLTWMQRILDLLVLVSSQAEVFAKGLTLLLGGAVLLWWDERDVRPVSSIQSAGFEGQDRSLERLVAMDDVEADLLAMTTADEHDLDDGDVSQRGDMGAKEMDYNILEDDEFELWHQRFLQSISVVAVDTISEEEERERLAQHQLDVMGRVSMVLPDIITSIRGNGSPSAIDSQTANRLLRMALDTQIRAHERHLLVGLLRRMEDLVPTGQSWILK